MMSRLSHLAAAVVLVLLLAFASGSRAARLDEALMGAVQMPQQCVPGEFAPRR
jgi:hypothetical protein